MSLPIDNIVYKFLQPMDLYNYIQTRKNIKIDIDTRIFLKKYIEERRFIVDSYMEVCRNWIFSCYSSHMIDKFLYSTKLYDKIEHPLKYKLPHPRDNFKEYSILLTNSGMEPYKWIWDNEKDLRKNIYLLYG